MLITYRAVERPELKTLLSWPLSAIYANLLHKIGNHGDTDMPIRCEARTCFHGLNPPITHKYSVHLLIQRDRVTAV